MNRVPAPLFLLFLLLLLAAQPAFGAEQNILAFTHATVIDATGAPAQLDVTVVITGDRITGMGKSADINPPTNAVVVDATGKFLIPGLWDMHVHPYQKDYLPLFIANGVTGIRIMWGLPMHHEWRKEIEQGTLLGPRMLIASSIVDGPKPIWPGSITAGNAAEGRQAVLKSKQDGADFVKVYTLLPRDAYFAIADEAKKQSIPFAGHVTIAVSAQEASAAGQKSIEHLTGILPACSSREDYLLKSAQETLATLLTTTNEPPSIFYKNRQSGQMALDTYSPLRAGALFAEFKKNHTRQCPTLIVLHNITFINDPSLASDSRLKYMPREIKSSWDPARDFRFKNRTAEDVALGKKVYQKELKLVGAMQRAGVGILAGTDTANPYCFPGFSLHDELGLLVRAGLTPMQALQAATLNPARFMGREKELGTIEKGKLADLVLLDANPLDNIANTRKITAVVFGGRLFPRSSLDEMLARVEALASKMSIAEILLKTVEEQGVEAAVKQYHELRAAQPGAYDFREEQLNHLGYHLIGMGRIKDAIGILKLNAEAYPQSSNAYDSLGEAYADDGDKEFAIENYEKSLQLDPKNHGAIEKLKQLKAH
jgi:imidazolonepropionase-like amidohydrolase